MKPYLLASHVHVCRTSDHIVLLDLRQDKYLALTDEDSRRLAAVVEGWPNLELEVEPIAADSSEQLVHALLDQQIVTKDAAAGRPATPVSLETPVDTFVHSYFIDRPRINSYDLAMFAKACVSAATALRWRPLESLVRSIQAGKRRRSHSSGDDRSLALVQRLAATFEGLRPYTLAGDRSCMFDSLALLMFMRAYDVHPTWVFGVCTSPFSAHCWLQDGDVVLNDTPQRVTAFTPILAI